MLVTHQFLQRNSGFFCPATPNDASLLTWFVLLCKDQPDAEACLTDPASRPCPIEGQGTATYCASVGATP
jgi:hypothetical protein